MKETIEKGNKTLGRVQGNKNEQLDSIVITYYNLSVMEANAG